MAVRDTRRSRSRPPSPLARGQLLLALLLAPPMAAAIEEMTLALGSLRGDGWKAEGVTVRLDATAGAPLSGELALDRLELPAPLPGLANLRFDCRRLEISAARLRCRQGRVFGDPFLGEPLEGDVQLDYAYDGTLSLSAALERVADGGLRLEMALGRDTRTLRIEGTRLEASRVLTLIGHVADTGGYEARGPISLDADLELGPDTRIDWRAAVHGHGLAFSDPGGRIAGEALVFDLNAAGAPTRAGWRLNGSLRLKRGALFTDPVYIEAGEQPVTLSASGAWLSESETLRVERFDYRHPAALEANGSLRLRPGTEAPLHALDARIERAALPAAYQTYLQPWLFGTALGDLETEGEASGIVLYGEAGLRRLEVNATGLGLTDRRRRFSVLGLSGDIAWTAQGPERLWELAWRSGSVYRIPFGSAAMALRVEGSSAALARPTRVPIFDGALAVNRWSVERLGDPSMSLAFDAELEPVSLAPLAEALDWPSLSGKVSGAIPQLSYAGGRLEVGGLLTVRAFDGLLTMKKLRLEQPFGLVPRLSADISLEGLDLEAVTRTFSLGRIEGRLEGHVKDLRMVSWEPVAFDAAFANPPDDDSRHRISQKAADDLLRIGGGVGGVLSQGFLGLFESFPYDRLGLSCRLERGVCLMDGIAPAEEGYYIVTGSGLPHINIIGHNRRVDWETLLARIRAVIAGGEPVVR